MNKKKSQKHCLSKKNIDADDPLLFHVLLLYLLKPVKEVNVLTHTLNPTGHAHYIFSNIQMLNPNIKPHRTRPLHCLQYPNVFFSLQSRKHKYMCKYRKS